MLGIERFELTHDFGRTNRIHVAERTAAEGRESNPEDRADVAVTRRTYDPLFQTTRGLIHHRE